MKIFKEEFFKTCLAFVDDILIKSMKRQDHISDLAVAFTRMRAVGLKLNPEKCVFRVTKGKILGYLVSSCQIKANSNKIQKILDME